MLFVFPVFATRPAYWLACGRVPLCVFMDSNFHPISWDRSCCSSFTTL